MLRAHTRHMPLAPDVDLEALSPLSSGYTGADLAAVCRQASMRALTSGEAAAADLVFQGVQALQICSA